MHGCDTDIESRRTNINALEFQMAKLCERSNNYKVKKGGLQDERKSLWSRENELTAEIDKLRAEVEKTEKSLDHAIPGVPCGVSEALHLSLRVRKNLDFSLGVFTTIFNMQKLLVQKKLQARYLQK
ncbi:structural maintenance of chromosomes protein [Medicago truncatula]|uniref:Structural maintenance of chromosomes protein n=1 Tax=Medicago truncatula TaxID=3880 RepID=G7KHF0_MEDTR|nr:structural maintenance of chromosomes protein [Medicago truncatula]